jgi:hypothetical protein
VHSILGTLDLFLSLMLGEFNQSEPFIRQIGDKVFIIIVGFKTIKSKQVGPPGWSFQSTGLDGFKQVIIHDMKLGADVICPEILNEANRASVQW